jgi:hemolysin III
MVKTQEAFNCYSHLTGAVAALIGTIFLLLIALDSGERIAVALLYGLSMVFMFSASALYHAFKKQENELSYWRKMDRLAIFFMIAGSYTPISYFFMDADWRLPMIALQWGLVVFGVCSQLFFPRAPRLLYSVIFLIMGWMLIFPIRQVVASMSEAQLVLLFMGGVAFTVGAVVYGIKKPVLFPGIFGFHEFFHVMVLVGAGCHFALIYSAFSVASVTLP